VPAPEPLGWDAYCERWSASHGGYDPRQASVLVRGWLRLSHRLGAGLVRRGVRSPDALTSAGLLLSAAVPLTSATLPNGALAAAVLVLCSAFADTLDGVVAVVAARATRLGQVYDAAAERVSEAAWLLAFTLLGAPPWLTTTCVAAMWLHEYIRARASIAGMSDIGTVTVAERPTRILLTIFGLLAAPLHPWAPTIAVAAMLAMAAVGFVQLLAAVRRALR
jgi:phosphatidylglycerophosphate synthase